MSKGPDLANVCRPSELELISSEVMSIKRLLIAPSVDGQKTGGVFAKCDYYFRETPQAFVVCPKAEDAQSERVRERE